MEVSFKSYISLTSFKRLYHRQAFFGGGGGMLQVGKWQEDS